MRLRLSVSVSTYTATPQGAYPSYDTASYVTPSSSPVPLLIARWMVSIGTDEARAFSYIVRSVGLASMSPPPSRADTSSWRMSLAKSLPRALSAAPFLCLMVAHFE